MGNGEPGAALPPPGWYASPETSRPRWWDGHAWIDDVTVGQTVNLDANPSTATGQVSHFPEGRSPGPAHPGLLADVGQRFAAWAIDLALVGAALLAASAVSLVVEGSPAGEAFAGMLVLFAIVLALLYEVVYPAHCGQTFGKHVLGIEIVRLDDGTAALGGGTAVGRQFIKGLGAHLFGLGLLWILVDGQRQGWHDKAAGTVVVRSTQPRLTIWEFLGQPFATRE